MQIQQKRWMKVWQSCKGFLSRCYDMMESKPRKFRVIVASVTIILFFPAYLLIVSDGHHSLVKGTIAYIVGGLCIVFIVFEEYIDPMI